MTRQRESKDGQGSVSPSLARYIEAVAPIAPPTDGDLARLRMRMASEVRPRRASAALRRAAFIAVVLMAGVATAFGGPRVASMIRERLERWSTVREKHSGASQRHLRESAPPASVTPSTPPPPAPSPSAAPLLEAAPPTPPVTPRAREGKPVGTTAPPRQRLEGTTTEGTGETRIGYSGAGPSEPSPPVAPDVSEGEEALAAIGRGVGPEETDRIVDDYVRRYPRGAMTQDLLYHAFARRSASDPRAVARGREYLARFPQGVWARAIREALGSAAP